MCALALAVAQMTGCADSLSASDAAGGEAQPRNGGTGVGQSGAQDFGRFRGIIDDGEVPAPNTLDQVGFFNEHKIELPPADCGQDVCLHGLMGVQGNMINGNNCTVAMLGFNTPLNPDDFERPPLNMAIAVDVSGSMAGAPLNAVKAGLRKLADELDPKDTVTLVAYSTEANVLVDSTPTDDPDREELKSEIDGLLPSGSTNIYDGLQTALDAVDVRRADNRQNRVIILSDGMATEGIQDTDRIINLGTTYAETGVGITTIGVGKEFDMKLMSELAQTGAGNFYFLENAGAVEEVFTEEIKTFLVPLAQDVQISYDPSDAYDFRAAYGSRAWDGDDRHVDVSIPALFMASRQSADDITPAGGRRGGGGMILFEIIPSSDQDVLDSTGPGKSIGPISMSYRKPGTDQTVEQTVDVVNPLTPGETPSDGKFDDPSVEKAFVALNIYAGFKMAVQRADAGSPNAALNVLIPLSENVQTWVDDHDDPDIADDLDTMNKLIENLQGEGGQETVGRPPNPWPRE